MSISMGYAALREHKMEQAEALFRAALDESPVLALAGLIRIRLLSNRAAEAVKFSQNLLELDRSPFTLGLMGETIGAAGKRSEAEQWINQALELAPNNGWLLALRGEQRVRRAQWEEGAQDLAKSLVNDSTRAAAFTHLVNILIDLSRAVAAKRVDSEKALWLVNRIEQNSQPYPELAFFPVARRSFAQGQGVPGNQRPAPVFPMEQGPPTRQERSIPVPNQARPKPLGARPKSIPMPQETAPQPLPHIREASIRQAAVREASMREASVGAIRPPLAEMMTEDRNANESLQKGVIQVGLPSWPSEQGSLDDIPNLRPALLNIDMESIRKSGVSLTTGSIDSEILISRGIEVLEVYSTRSVSRSLSFDMVGVSQVEVQCLAGLLDELPPISDEYNLNGNPLDVKVIALGAYLGTVACKKANAVWRLVEPVEKSFVELGTENFHPFKLAREWISSRDKSKVELYSTLLAFLNSSGKLEHREHSDYTASLNEVALKNKIAELWASYFPPAVERNLVDVIGAIQLKEQNARAVLFDLPNTLTPNLGFKRTSIAYMRKTGDFLLLPYRSHFARFLGDLGAGLEDSGKMVLNATERYHLQGGRVIRSGDRAPTLRAEKKGTTLSFYVEGINTEYNLTHHPSGLQTWVFNTSEPRSAAA